MSSKKATKRKREEKDKETVVTKQSLNEAIALIYEDEEERKAKKKTSVGNKVQRECWSSSLKAQSLKSVAEIYSSDNSQIELLEELRVSLLENNFSASANILKLILNSGTKAVLPVIWKTLAVLFLKQHPDGNESLEEFLEMCVDQRSQEDKTNFIKTLVSMPDLLEERSVKKHNKKNKGESINDIVLSEDEMIFNEKNNI